jgi:hypothetical protein
MLAASSVTSRETALPPMVALSTLLARLVISVVKLATVRFHRLTLLEQR